MDTPGASRHGRGPAEGAGGAAGAADSADDPEECSRLKPCLADLVSSFATVPVRFPLVAAGAATWRKGAPEMIPESSAVSWFPMSSPDHSGNPTCRPTHAGCQRRARE